MGWEWRDADVVYAAARSAETSVEMRVENPGFTHNTQLMPRRPAFVYLPVLLFAVGLAPIAGAELVISGVDDELRQNIRAFVSLAEEPCNTEDWRLRRRYRTAVREARKALEPFGYYRPTITSTLTRDDNCWYAELEVDAGEPVRYREVSITLDGEAVSDTEFMALTQSAAITTGAVLRHSDFERVKRRFITRAAGLGYVEGEFTELGLDIWPDDLAADVTLHYDSGPRYRIGEIAVQQDVVTERLVQGFIDLERGQSFSSDELVQTQRNLSDSGYFGSVQVIANSEQAADGEIPIDILLSPGTRTEYTVGVGASTDTGGRFRAGYRNNRVNRKGHRLTAGLGYSPVLKTLTSEYRIPLRDPRREWFSLTAGVLRQDTATFEDSSQQLGARWTRAVTDSWLRTFFVDATNESFTVGEVQENSRFIVPGLGYSQKKSDLETFPSRGRRIEAELRVTDESLGSSTGFVQTVVDTRWVRSFGERYRVLARLKAGMINAGNFDELPPSLRFYAGGDESLRGYDYESLGPVDADGNVVGGNRLLLGSLEIERRLKGRFYGAVFVDGGNAFNDTDLNAEAGAGFGIKWRSPLGTIRAYVGFPVTRDGGSPRLHLRLGADL